MSEETEGQDICRSIQVSPGDEVYAIDEEILHEPLAMFLEQCPGDMQDLTVGELLDVLVARQGTIKLIADEGTSPPPDGRKPGSDS